MQRNISAQGFSTMPSARQMDDWAWLLPWVYPLGGANLFVMLWMDENVGYGT